MKALSVLLSFLLFLTPAFAVDLKPGLDGIEIDAGSIGRFVLAYPQFIGADEKPAHQLIEKAVAGNTATLKYDGGVQLDIAVNPGGAVTMKFAQPPAKVKTVTVEMQIPIAFNQGGRWNIADQTAAFPVQKPAAPHLYSGNGNTFQLFNFEGRGLVIGVPEFTFQQLSDNREWNWAIFNWKTFIPLNAHLGGLNFSIVTKEPAGGVTSKPLVDQFGQSTLSDWPGKVKSLEELKADVEAEKAYYASLTPPARDEYGGLPGSKEKLGLKATGYFHVEKKGERWLLVNPAGNAFFHLGLCGVIPNDDFTLVKGRESAYEFIPDPKGEFASAFREGSEGTIVSYHLVNQIRKYGAPFTTDAYNARMIERMKAWGFNSVGAFSPGGLEARKAAKFPEAAHLPLNFWEGIARIPGIHETFDPFDEKTRQLVDQNMAKELPARANDPLIIGYFIVNEPIYEEIPRIVPSLKASQHACKARFVEWLEKKYGGIDRYNAAWASTAENFAALREAGLAIATDAARADSVEFASVFLDEYMRLVKDAFRKYDPNHLLIGSRLQPGTISHEWICRTMGKHVDVMSYNYYTYDVDAASLRQIYDWTGGKPMMLSEFFWSSPKDSGLTGGRELATQQERGLCYRNYVEQSAALGFVVGIEWFTLVDQSVTGRWFSGFDGERANTGVLSVVDRPWKPVLEEMMKTNYGIYPVWFGEQAPFAWKKE